MSDTTLYERIGGQPVIEKMVPVFYEKVLADPELAPFFEKVSMEKLHKMQVEFFAAALDGPVEYAGLSLAYAHFGKGITRKHFARFVACLLETLEGMEIDELEVQDIIERVNTYITDITGLAGAAG